MIDKDNWRYIENHILRAEDSIECLKKAIEELKIRFNENCVWQCHKYPKSKWCGKCWGNENRTKLHCHGEEDLRKICKDCKEEICKRALKEGCASDIYCKHCGSIKFKEEGKK